MADYGTGIPEAFQQKVFDKFFRIHSESAQSGVGLGLAICRAIIEAHGGKILATNRSGGGSVFQLLLPNLECPPTIDSEEYNSAHGANCVMPHRILKNSIEHFLIL